MFSVAVRKLNSYSIVNIALEFLNLYRKKQRILSSCLYMKIKLLYYLCFLPSFLLSPLYIFDKNHFILSLYSIID